MSDVLTRIVHDKLVTHLSNVRNTLIVSARNYQGHIDKIQKLVNDLERSGHGQMVSAVGRSYGDLVGYWNNRKTLMEPGGESLVSIIDGYISAVESATADSQSHLDNAALKPLEGGFLGLFQTRPTPYTMNFARHVLGLTNELEPDNPKFAANDAKIQPVSFDDLLLQGAGALGSISTFVASQTLDTAHDGELHQYVDYEFHALNVLSDWADQLHRHQRGFIGRLKNVDHYLGAHKLPRGAESGHDSQAQIIESILGGTDDQGNKYYGLMDRRHDLTSIGKNVPSSDEAGRVAISIVTILNDDGTTGILVRLAGVNTIQPGYDGANNLGRGVGTGAGLGQTDYYNDAKAAIADYFSRHPELNSSSTPITLEGHSLGGMVAEQLADANDYGKDHNIREVITFGSPNLQIGVHASTAVNMYTNMGDPIPLFNGKDFQTNFALVAAGRFDPSVDPLRNPAARAYATHGETIVDGGTNLDPSKLLDNHGAYPDSSILQSTSTDFVIPQGSQALYYSAPQYQQQPQYVYQGGAN